MVSGVAGLVLVLGLAACEDDGGGGGGGNASDVYLAVGDSITTGNGGASAPYPAILAGRINRRVVNEGRGGETTGMGLSRVDTLLEAYRPQYLLIFYGTNDLLFNSPAELIIADLRSIIGKAKARDTVPVIATLLPPAGSYAGRTSTVQAFNQMIRQMAAEENVRVADMERAFPSDPAAFLQADGLHPNDAGNELIAEVFRGTL